MPSHSDPTSPQVRSAASVGSPYLRQVAAGLRHPCAKPTLAVGHASMDVGSHHLSVWTWKHRTCDVGTSSGSCLPAPGPGSGRAEAAPCKKRPADAPVSVVSPSSVVGARPPHRGLPGSSLGLGLGPAPEVRCLPWVPLPLQTVPSSELRIPTYCGNGNQTTVVTADSPPSWHFPAIISSNPFMGAASGHFQCPVFLFLPTSYTTLVQFPSSTVHWMDAAGV